MNNRHPFRLVRHLGNGMREVLIEGLMLTNDEAGDFNVANVRTMLRIWPITKEAPLRRDDSQKQFE